jgi:hypothetical protein
MPCPAPEIAVLQHLDLVQGAVPFTDQLRAASWQLAQCRIAICLGRGLKVRLVRADNPPKALTWTSLAMALSIRARDSRGGGSRPKAMRHRSRSAVRSSSARAESSRATWSAMLAVMVSALPVRLWIGFVAIAHLRVWPRGDPQALHRGEPGRGRACPRRNRRRYPDWSSDVIGCWARSRRQAGVGWTRSSSMASAPRRACGKERLAIDPVGCDWTLRFQPIAHASRCRRRLS